ncbi:hypothetical protein G6F71_005969 [Rhizopus microsporus]|nr:hypothetical protein G6F71_005969 [Rhizopus microsporus]KAG1210332.1 hypothetical protein G6F69_005566 [Rhizopus microsporus]KAG1232037.1 hypothetical protein G6F67_005305 [Rhizopus microsporus]KAG1269492.1 hypothetical protein G6F68_000213 [Rhizopus microsporus]
MIHTYDLPPDNYEFTLRFKKQTDDQWSWYGKPGQNGHIRLAKDHLSTECLPHLDWIANETSRGFHLDHFSAPIREKRGQMHLGRVGPMYSYVSYLRKGVTWLTPISGKDCLICSLDKHQLLLYRDNEAGNLHLWMACSSSLDCWFSYGANNNINIHYQVISDSDAQIQEHHVHVLVLEASDPLKYTSIVAYALEYYFKQIAKISDTIKNIAQSTQNGTLSDTLGYCTWNALGTSMTFEKLLRLLSDIRSNNIPVRYLIIDDGWQHTSSKSRMATFDVHPTRFPDLTLKEVVTIIKKENPFLSHVGVWHTLCGYWNGICTSFADSQGYDPIDITNNQGTSIGLVKHADLFYDDFYKFLHASNVDFVKVDNQGGFLNLPDHCMHLWNEYRKAVVKASDEQLEGRVIHCMSLTPYILFNPVLSCKTKCTFRSSDDFFPDVIDSHPWHIYVNAINALWLRCYPVIPDWDMFQSDHAFGEYHASSRAISGGPIYITDNLGKHSLPLIEALVAISKSRGPTLLRSCQPPIPTFDTVFGDPMGNGALLSMYNVNIEELDNTGRLGYGVCGFWNTTSCERLGVVKGSMFNLPILSKRLSVAYVVTGRNRGKLTPLFPKSNLTNKDSHTEEAMLIPINGFESSLIAVCCTHSIGSISAACLGLIDKMNGTRAILKTRLIPMASTSLGCLNAKFEAYLSHKSQSCGFWIATCHKEAGCQTENRQASLCIKRVLIDGFEMSAGSHWTFETSSGLLKVNMLNTSSSTFEYDYYFVQVFIEYEKQR